MEYVRGELHQIFIVETETETLPKLVSTLRVKLVILNVETKIDEQEEKENRHLLFTSIR